MAVNFATISICLILFWIVLSVLRKKLARISFKDRLIWITGASSGIGKELAARLSHLGASLILSSRNQEELEKVKQSCLDPSKVTIFPLDMSKPVDVLEKTTSFIKNLESQKKHLDMVIENAGVAQRGLSYLFDFDNHLYLTNVNYLGPVAHTKAIIQHMVQSKRGGHIVITNSICGKLAPGYRSSYVGSKHALTGYYDSIRAELYSEGIHVTQIFPSYVHTNVSKNALVEKKGQSLDKTDTNIGGGMDVKKFCDAAIYHIYRKTNEAIITNSFKDNFGIIMRNLVPDLIFYLLHRNTKQQIDAVRNAK